MANILDSNGLQLDTRPEIEKNLKEAFTRIYEDDETEITFDSNSTDGQFLEILSQQKADQNELITNVYNSFFPNKVGGSLQDERYAINGIFRKEGKYTIQPIDININSTVTLQGLDTDDNPNAYTLQDNDGNHWYLLDTTTLTDTDKTYSLSFRAKEMGDIRPTIGTITSQVTVVTGVTKVNNSVAPTSYGIDEGTDYDFMIRREQSVANGGENNATTIKGQILALESVNQCEVYEYEETRDEFQKLIPDKNGVPPYASWVIVDGGNGYDIANIIYNNSQNTMLLGSVVENVLTASGQYLPIHFDRPNAIPLYIKFNLKELVADTVFDFEEIKNKIVEDLKFTMNQFADTSYITDVIRNVLLQLSVQGVVLEVQISNSLGTLEPTTSSSTINNLQVNLDTFYNKIQTTGTYIFDYNGAIWTLDETPVLIEEYGIAYDGTPELSDTIELSYNEGTWAGFIASETPQNQFVIDMTRIYITEINI